MKITLALFSKQILKAAAMGIALTIAMGSVPETVQAQARRPPCKRPNPPAYCPKKSSTPKGIPENPVGALLGAATVGGMIVVLKRRKRTPESSNLE